MRRTISSRALGVAANAPAPRSGEIIRTRVPDSMKGIRFEMDRMAKMVQDAVGDPVVVDAARMVTLAAHEKNRVSELGALFEWTKAHYHYVSDPIGKEVLQSANRMVKQIQVPKKILATILAPLYGSGKGRGGIASMSGGALKGPLPKATGDCDEGSVLIASLCGAVGILPRFRFGGAGNSLYHVWVQGFVPPGDGHGVGPDGAWVDMDVTEKSYGLGQYAPFARYARMEIFSE